MPPTDPRPVDVPRVVEPAIARRSQAAAPLPAFGWQLEAPCAARHGDGRLPGMADLNPQDAAENRPVVRIDRRTRRTRTARDGVRWSHAQTRGQVLARAAQPLLAIHSPASRIHPRSVQEGGAILNVPNITCPPTPAAHAVTASVSHGRSSSRSAKGIRRIEGDRCRGWLQQLTTGCGACVS